MQLIIKTSKILEQGILFFTLSLVFLYDAFSGTLGFLDELTALISFIVLFFFLAIKGKTVLFRKEYYILLLLGLIMIIGLSSNFLNYQNGFVTAKAAIIGDFINVFKPFITYLAIRLLSESFDANIVLKKLSKYAERIFYVLVFIIIIDLLFKIYPRAPRYGFNSIELFFKHGSRYGFAFSFIFLMLLPKYFKTNKKFLFFILIIGMLSLRVKFFGFVTVSLIFMFYGKKLFEIPKLYFLLIISGLGLVMVWLFQDKILEYFTFESLNDAWSRAVILYYSVIIGNDYFPLGTGFGTYSSYYSGLHYSWVYDLYGINEVYGMKRAHWKFIADQYWPMVLGQFGYFGLLSMVLIIYNYLTLFMNNIKAHKNNSKYYYYYLGAILGLLLLLIDSTSDAIFTQQRAVVMFIYFALVVNATSKKHNVVTIKNLVTE